MKVASIVLILAFGGVHPAVAQSRGSDSVDFHPDGVFSPLTPIKIASTIVTCFEIKTFEYVYDEASKKYFSRSLPPSVDVFFRTPLGLHSRPANHLMLSRDTLSFSVSHPSFGVMTFHGTFLDKSGHYTSSENNPFRTYAVVQGNVSIVRDSTSRFSSIVRWTYSASD